MMRGLRGLHGLHGLRGLGAGIHRLGTALRLDVRRWRPTMDRVRRYGCIVVGACALVFGVACERPRAQSALPAATRHTEAGANAKTGDLSPMLEADADMAPLMADAERRRAQILVSIPRDDGTLERHAYRLDAEYFYPASAVKLPVAVAAVEKLDELRAQRGDLDLDTPLRISFADERTRPLETTLRSEIERALVISDNDAYNRLFDLVGVEELADRLRSYGLPAARIVHHLGVGDERDAGAPSFELRGAGPTVVVAQRVGVALAPPTRALVGAAHVSADGRVVDAPFDFGEKNRMSLGELQDMLASVVRPDLADLPSPRLADADRRALAEILARTPSDLGGPALQQLDDRHKPLRRAVATELPDHVVRVHGKGGRAYGFTVENAYVVDETSNRSAFVSATIYANDNETINDDRYEYESVADPFVAQLGRFVARTFLR